MLYSPFMGKERVKIIADDAQRDTINVLPSGRTMLHETISTGISYPSLSKGLKHERRRMLGFRALGTGSLVSFLATNVKLNEDISSKNYSAVAVDAAAMLFSLVSGFSFVDSSILRKNRVNKIEEIMDSSTQNLAMLKVDPEDDAELKIKQNEILGRQIYPIEAAEPETD